MTNGLKGYQGFLKTHGDSNSRLYKLYCGIKQRCFYLKNINYKNYGGRGIIMCEEWKNNYSLFKKWSLNNGYIENEGRNILTIDRIDNNGNYEPNNCRFITNKENSQNRRNNYSIEYNGEFFNLKNLCSKLDLKYTTIRKRVYDGIPINKALDKNYKQKRVNNFPKYNIGEFPRCCINMEIARKIRNEDMKYKDIAKKYNVSFYVVADIKKGKTYKEINIVNDKLIKE
jgi:hypothetical protein